MKILFYSFMFTCCIATVSSCKKTKDTPAPVTTTPNQHTTTPPATTKDTSTSHSSDMRTALNKKWNVGNSTARITTDPAASDYVSFEFNAAGNYFIVMADKSLVSGTFTVSSIDSIVTLFNANSTTSQYGVLSIKEITDTKLVFKLTLNTSSNPVSISTSAATTTIPAATSQAVNATDSLTKTWNITQRATSAGTVDVSTSGGYGHVTFTQYGTFWTETYNGQNVTQQNGQWIWSDATQMAICTSSSDTAPDCSSPMRVSFDGKGNLILNYIITGQGAVTDYYSPLK